LNVDFLSEMLVGAKKLGHLSKGKESVCLVRLRVVNECNWRVGPQWDLPTRIHLIVIWLDQSSKYLREKERKLNKSERNKQTKCFESKAAW